MSLQIRMARYAMESEYAGYGDYGDPGIGSIIKGAGKFLGKVGKTVAKNIPIVAAGAAIAGAGIRLIKPGKKPRLLGPGLPTSSAFPMAFAEPEQQPVLQMPGTGIQVQLPRGPFGIGGGGMQVGTFRAPSPPPMVEPGRPTGTQLCQLPSGGLRMRPTHANRSGYYIRSGANTGTYIPPGTKCVTNRRMNPLNPHALHRAITRIVSGKRAASFLSRITVRSACNKTRALSRRRSHGSGCACKSCKR